MKYVADERLTAYVEHSLVTFEKGDYVSELSTKEISELMDSNLVRAVPEQEDLTGLDYPKAFWPEDKIRKVKKKSALVEYGAFVGVEGLNEQMTLIELADAVVDFIQNVEHESGDGGDA